MADKEYIAGDPADVLNVFKTLKQISELNVKNRTIKGQMVGIEKKLNESIADRSKLEKDLLKTNIQIEVEVSKIKSLEDARLKGYITSANTQDKINKSYRTVNSLLNLQSQIQRDISIQESQKTKKQLTVELFHKSIQHLQGKYLGDVMSLVKIWGNAGISLFFVFELVKKIFDVFVALDESAMEFRKEMGFTRQYTEAIDKYARDAAVSLSKFGVTGKEAYEAVVGISKELYTSMSVTPSLVRDMSLLAAQLGISAQSSVELLRSLSTISGTTTSMQRDAVFFTTALSEAAGTPLKDVMKDISDTTKSMFQFVSKSGIELIKAAVESRRMGTSLSSATKTSASLLEFTKSVSTEMEASVLLGRSVNLQKARELSYHRDIRGLNLEILKIAKETNFENLDPFQQDAVARALGKSADELATMVQADREMKNIEAAMTPEMLTQHKIMQDMLNANNQQVKNYAEQARLLYLQEGNQTRVKNIANSWNSIVMQLARVFLPAIDISLKLIADNMEGVVKITSAFFGWIKIIGAVLFTLGTRFTQIYISVGKFLGISSKLSLTIFKISTFFGKWLNPIGWIITGVMFLINLFKRFDNAGFVKGDWIGNFWKGIKAIGGAIYDTLIQPFVDVYDWIMKRMGGHSPSEIGLSILEGIVAVEGLIFKSLLSPFTMAWEAIKKLPLMSHFFGGRGIDVNIIPDVNANISVDKPMIGEDNKKKSSTIGDVVDNFNDIISKKLDSVVDAITGLRDDMKNGSITSTVFLDSQKLDSSMGRRLKYTGALI